MAVSFVSFKIIRTLYDFDLNEAIDVHDYFYHIR